VGYTVPFRPTQLVIVIGGSARRFFGQCHRSSGVCRQLRSVMVFSEFGSCGGEPVTVWHRRSLAQWYYGGVSSPSGPPPGEHLSSSSGLPPLSPVLIFSIFFVIDQPPAGLVGMVQYCIQIGQISVILATGDIGYERPKAAFTE